MSPSAVVRPLPGPGIVARAGDLLLVCADDADGIDELLSVLEEVAAGDRDGGTLVRRVAALLAADFDGRFPACAVSGPASGGRLAVLVYGAATAHVTGGGGEFTLSGADAITSVNRMFAGVAGMRLQLPGAGPADPRSRLDSGVIVAAGVWYAETDGAAPAGARPSTEPAPTPPAEAARTPVLAPTPEPVGVPVLAPPPEPAGAPVLTPPEPAESASEPALEPPEPRYEEPEPVQPEAYEAERAGPEPEAPEPGPEPEAPEPEAPEPEPEAPEPAVVLPMPPVHVSPPGPPPPPPVFEAPPVLEAPPEPPPGPASPPLRPLETGGPANVPKVREPEPSAPFVAVLLGPGAGESDEPPVAADHEHVRPTVMGVMCVNDHFNDPGARYCAECGVPMTDQTPVTQEGPRPALGVLVLDDGAVFLLDVDYVIGREPHQDAEVAGGVIRPLRVADADGVVSRRHARVALVGWEVQVVDLGSANGTFVQLTGDPQRHQLVPNQPVVIRPGTQVTLGRRWFRYESHRNP